MKNKGTNKKVWGKPAVKILSVKENTKGGTPSTMEAGPMKLAS